MKKGLLIWILSGITIVSLATAIYFALFYRPANPLPPDYAPVEPDTNADKMEEQSTEKMDAFEGGSAVSVVSSGLATINLNSGEISISYENPSRSLASAILQLIIQDTVVAQSGTIQPGYKLEKMQLLDGVQLSPGTYEGTFLISFYDEESREKAIVNSTVPATVTVEE